MTNWERIERYMKHTGCGWRGFCDISGYSQGTLVNIKKTERASAKFLRRLKSMETEAGIASDLTQDDKKTEVPSNPHPISSKTNDSTPYGTSPPACDTKRLDRLEQAVSELTTTMREENEAIRKQNEAMLANINAMNTVLLRLLAEQEPGNSEDSNGLAG